MSEGESKWGQDFFDMVEPLRLKDPLAYILGSMEEGELFVFDGDHFEYNTFIFQRLDTEKTVSVTYNPDVVPEDPGLGELISLVLTGEATEEEHKAFKKAWQGKVRMILLEDNKLPGLFEVREVT